MVDKLKPNEILHGEPHKASISDTTPTSGMGNPILFKTTVVAAVGFAGLSITAKVLQFESTVTLILTLTGLTLIIWKIAHGYFKWQQNFGHIQEISTEQSKSTVTTTSAQKSSPTDSSKLIKTTSGPAAKSRLLTEQLPQTETPSQTPPPVTPTTPTTVTKEQYTEPHMDENKPLFSSTVIENDTAPITIPSRTAPKPQTAPSHNGPIKYSEKTRIETISAPKAEMVQVLLREYTDADGVIHKVVKETKNNDELECEYVKGLRHGPAKSRQTDTGNKLYSWFSKGKREGDAIETLGDGTCIIFSYKEGKKQGYAVRIKPDHQIQDFCYVDGKEQSLPVTKDAVKAYHPTKDGGLLSSNLSGIPNGKAVELVGNILTIFNLTEGIRYGTAKSYNLSTLVITQFEYDNNTKDGSATETDSTGMITSFQFKNNRREGPGTIIYHDGKVREIFYENDVIKTPESVTDDKKKVEE